MDQDATWHGGTEVGIGPGHIVLDGDPAHPSKGHSPSPQLSAHICCGPVNSSHGQLVTQSSRHTVNSSPVNSSHNTDRICIPEKIIQVCQRVCRSHHTALSNAAAPDSQCPPTIAAVGKNSRAIARPPALTYAAAPVTAREPKFTKKGKDLSG